MEELFTGRRVAGKGDAGGRGLAAIAEYHGLHRDGGAPILGNIVELAIGIGAVLCPAAEHGADGAPELLVDVFAGRAGPVPVPPAP